MREVRFIQLYRAIVRIFPLKYRLNFLIRSYLSSEDPIIIPYVDGYKISIVPNSGNHRTLSDLIFEGPRYLPEYSLVKQIKKQLPKNFTYIDVGGNIGTTLWLFAKDAGKVYVFEPIPHLFSTITESMSVNELDSILAINKALGNESGVVNMLNNNNSNVVLGENGDSIKIDLSTLDEELNSAGRIDLIKIDVEGFELKVLNGSWHIIEQHRPRLLLEIHPLFIKDYGDSIELLLNSIEKRGYRISYYSFLNELRLSRIARFLARYRTNSGVRFNSKSEFMEDITKSPSLTSYHIYCEPA